MGMYTGGALGFAASAEPFVAEHRAELCLVVTLLEEKPQSILDDGALADALEERKAFQAIREIDIERMRDFRYTALVGGVRGRRGYAFRLLGGRTALGGAGGLLVGSHLELRRTV